MNKNSIEFKNKYLKYKNKYISLKNQLSFTFDTIIKQTGGAHTKLIFPRNIPEIHPNTTYTNYVSNLIFYLIANPELNNLWMMIGATNGSHSDVARFQSEYDITITAININIHEPNLLSLYSDDEEINSILPNTEHNLYKKLGNKHIYDLLADYLSEKFSKIIYDWSTTKFILANDQIFNELRVIKKLIALNGELYIDTFRESMWSILMLETTDGHKYYLKTSTWDPITETRSPQFNVTPDILKRYVGYNIGYTIQVEIQSQMKKINDPETLFTHMEQDGSIPKAEIDKHIMESDYHAAIEKSRHAAETIHRLNIIFPPPQYRIEYIQNYEYPNNPNTPEKRINEFYLITRIT